MIAGLLRQMMTLIEDVNRIFRIREYRAAAHHQIGQDQVLIGDNAIYPMNILAGPVKVAIFIMAALAMSALGVVRRNPGPGCMIDLFRPAVSFPIPLPFAKRRQH